jgi:catechol 2,3-dioxygenase-like lactoylglutathione lyase family enzyme
VEITPVYHVAFLVADLDRAVDDWGRALGFTFRPPQALAKDADGTPVRSSYSYQGPPYVQLIEGRPTGVYGLDRGEGFHHFGVWVDDAHAAREQLDGAGVRAQVTFDGADGRTVAWYSQPGDLHGARIEYVGEAARPGVEAYLRDEGALSGAVADDDDT